MNTFTRDKQSDALGTAAEERTSLMDTHAEGPRRSEVGRSRYGSLQKDDVNTVPEVVST